MKGDGFLLGREMGCFRRGLAESDEGFEGNGVHVDGVECVTVGEGLMIFYLYVFLVDMVWDLREFVSVG